LGPAYDASIASLDYFLDGSIIPERLPIGTEQTIDSVQQGDFQDFYKTYYRPDNAVIVMVGDSDVATMKRLIKQQFGDWTVEGEPPVEFEPEEVPIKGKEAIYYHDPEISSALSLNVMSPRVLRDDTAKSRKTAFIEGLGNRMLSRRLSRLSQEPDAQFLSASVSSSSVFDTQRRASITMSMQPELWNEALTVAEQELRRAIEHGFTQAELDEQLANSRKSAEVAVQTSPTRRSRGLASGLLNGVYNDTVVTSPESTYERFIGFVDDITLAQAEEAFREIWANYEKPQIYMNSPLKIDMPESVMLGAYDSSAAVAVSAPESQELAEFAYTDFGPVGEIVSRVENKDVGFETVTFANNVRLHFKKTDFRKDVISISAKIDGTTLTFPQELTGLSGFASTALNAGGLGAHSADELQTILAGKAVSASLSLGQGGFTLSGSTVPVDLPDQLNLMIAKLTDPGYREEALTRYVKSLENVFNTLETTPQSTASRYVSQILRSGNPRFRSPEKEEYLTASLDEVRGWVTPPDVLISEMARTFGALPSRKAVFEEVDLSLRQLKFPAPTETPNVLYHKGDPTTSRMSVYWPRPPYNTPEDWPRSVRISLINSMLRLRLIEVLREEEGATYSPGLTSYASEIFPDFAYSGVIMEVVPDDIDRLYGVIDQVTSEVHRGEFEADLLERARKPILERLETREETNGYWLGVIARAHSEPWNLERHLIRSDTYRAVTVEELQQVAGDLYDPKKAVRLKIIKGDTELNKRFSQ